MTDITISDAAVEAAARAQFEWSGDKSWDDYTDHDHDVRNKWRHETRAGLRAAAPYIAAQERQRVADEIDLPAVMAHLLRGSRDDLILADRINVAIGASRVRRIEAGRG